MGTPVKEERNDRAFSFILITVFLDGIGTGIIFPILPLLLVELTGERVQDAAVYGGWLSAWFSAVQFFAAPVLGNLSDCYGRRPILLGSLAGLGINSFIMAVAPSLGWLYVGSTLSGAFSATLSAANAYTADATPPEYRARKFGVIMAALLSGLVMGPILVGLLGSYGTRMPFFVAAGLALLNVMYGFFILPESLHAQNRRSFSLARANPFGTFAQLRTLTLVPLLLGAFGLMQIALITAPVTLGYFTVLKFAWSQREIGIALGLSAIATITFQSVLLSRLNRRLGTLQTACFGFSCIAVGMLGWAFSSESWMIFASIIPSAFGPLTSVVLIGHMSAHMSADTQGELQGAVASTSAAAAAITPPLMTHLFSRFADNNAAIYFPGAPFLLAALFACFGLLITARICRTRAVPR